MKTNSLFFSSLTVVALSGAGWMFHVRDAQASPREQIVVAEAGIGLNGMDNKSISTEAAPVTHHGSGMVKKIDTAKGRVILAHGPIPSLKWSAMTMSFKLKDAGLAKGIRVNDAVDFEFIQSGDDYVVTRLQPAVNR